MTEIPYVRRPTDFSKPVRYAHGPDSHRHLEVPRGTIDGFEWTASSAFPGTNRREGEPENRSAEYDSWTGRQYRKTLRNAGPVQAGGA